MPHAADSWFASLYRSFWALMKGLYPQEPVDFDIYNMPDRVLRVAIQYYLQGQQNQFRSLCDRINWKMSDEQGAVALFEDIRRLRAEEDSRKDRSVWKNHTDLMAMSDIARCLSQTPADAWYPDNVTQKYPELSAEAPSVLATELFHEGSLIVVVNQTELSDMFSGISSACEDKRHNTYLKLMGMGSNQNGSLVPAVHVVVALKSSGVDPSRRWQYMGFTQSDEIPRSHGSGCDPQTLAERVYKRLNDGPNGDFVSLALGMDLGTDTRPHGQGCWGRVLNLTVIQASGLQGLSEEKLKWARAHGDPLALAASIPNVPAVEQWIGRNVSVDSVRLPLPSGNYERLSKSIFFTVAERACFTKLDIQASRLLAQFLSQLDRLGLFVTTGSAQGGPETGAKFRERWVCNYPEERLQLFLDSFRSFPESQDDGSQEQCLALAKKVIVRCSDPLDSMDDFRALTEGVIALCQLEQAERKLEQAENVRQVEPVKSSLGAATFLMESELRDPGSVLTKEVSLAIKERLDSSGEMLWGVPKRQKVSSWRYVASAIMYLKKVKQDLKDFPMDILARHDHPGQLTYLLLWLRQNGFPGTGAQLEALRQSSRRDLHDMGRVIQAVLDAKITLTSDEWTFLLRCPQHQLPCDRIVELGEDGLLTQENFVQLLEAEAYDHSNGTHPSAERFPEQTTTRLGEVEAVASGAPRVASWLARSASSVGDLCSGFRQAAGYLWAQRPTWGQERVDHAYSAGQAHGGSMGFTEQDVSRDKSRSAAQSPQMSSRSGGGALMYRLVQPDSLLFFGYCAAYILKRSVVNPLSHSESSHSALQEEIARELAGTDFVDAVKKNLTATSSHKIESSVQERTLKFWQASLRDPSKGCDRDQLGEILQEHCSRQRVGPKKREAFFQQTAQAWNESVQPLLERRSGRSAHSSHGFFHSEAPRAAALNSTTYDARSVQPKPLSS